MVIWFVGLSGAGKTTIGYALYEQLKAYRNDVVFVDGDEIREIFGHDQSSVDYSIKGRRQSAERLHKICAWLDRQGIDVVCCLISMFPDITENNRKTYSRFFEVYVDVPLSVLSERDNKGLYQSALADKNCDVVGVTIPYPVPIKPDLVINNRFKAQDVSHYVNKIVELLHDCGEVK